MSARLGGGGAGGQPARRLPPPGREEEGFPVFDFPEAARRAHLILMLIRDEVQPEIFREHLVPHLEEGDGVVFAHGFAVRYGLIEPPPGVDLMMLAPRLPGPYLRERYLAGWGVPAYVAVERDASSRAWPRLLALARALGVTRCGALELSFAQETELDLFSQHFTYPALLHLLECAFGFLVEAGFPPEAALTELYGSGEMGLILQAAAREGLRPMLESHASPACQVGIAHHWEQALGPEEEVRERMAGVLAEIRSGAFARYLRQQQRTGYPELGAWKKRAPRGLAEAEQRLSRILRGPRPAGASEEPDSGC